MNEIDFLRAYSQEDKDIPCSVMPNNIQPEGVNNTYQINVGNHRFRVAFYPRNILPANVADGDYIFATRPPWMREKWVDYVKATSNKNAMIVGDKQLPQLSGSPGVELSLKVESVPTPLLNAARFLKPENYGLTKLYHSFTQQVKGPAFGEFIDLVVAGKFIDFEGKIKDVPDFEGEALMLCALLGNRNSVEELIRRKQALTGIDGRGDKARGEIGFNMESESGLQISDLIAVHVTNYLPYTDGSGKLCIRSTYDSTKEVIGRLSIHFALNHHVVSHSAGTWDTTPYVVISPLQDLIDLNGLPASMRPEDTFFLTSPGVPLRLPETTIVVTPRENKDRIPAKVKHYNTRNFSRSDLTKIASEWKSLFWVKHHREDAARYSVHPASYSSFEEFAKALGEEKRGKGLGLTNLLRRIQDSFGRIVGVDNNNFYFHESKLKRLIDQQPAEAIPGGLAVVHKKIIVDEAITDLGGKVQNVDPHYLPELGDGEAEVLPPDVEEILNLARIHGINTTRHFAVLDDTESTLETIGRWIAGDYPRQESERGESLLMMQQGLRNRFIDSGPQLRRMIYLMGAYQIADF